VIKIALMMSCLKGCSVLDGPWREEVEVLRERGWRLISRMMILELPLLWLDVLYCVSWS